MACVMYDMITAIKSVIEWLQDKNTMLRLTLKIWVSWFTKWHGLESSEINIQN